MKLVAARVCHVSFSLHIHIVRDGPDMTFTEMLPCRLVSLPFNQIFFCETASHYCVSSSVHLQFKSLSAASDQGINTKKLLCFEEAPAIFSTHTRLPFTSGENKGSHAPDGVDGRRMRCFFPVSPPVYRLQYQSRAQNDEPGQADSSALSRRNGNAFTQWVSPERGQVNMADGRE